MQLVNENGRISLWASTPVNVKIVHYEHTERQAVSHLHGLSRIVNTPNGRPWFVARIEGFPVARVWEIGNSAGYLIAAPHGATLLITPANGWEDTWSSITQEAQRLGVLFAPGVTVPKAARRPQGLLRQRSTDTEDDCAALAAFLRSRLGFYVNVQNSEDATSYVLTFPAGCDEARILSLVEEWGRRR